MNDSHYTDIFDKPLDPPFERQVEQIETLYSSGELPPQLSWARLQLQMRQQHLVNRKQRRLALNWTYPQSRSPHRLALVAGLLLCVLLFSGFTYVIINLGVLGNLLSSEPASQQLLLAKQFTTINQSQVVNGYKVTLDRAYADANRVILGFTATYPTGINQSTQHTSFIASNLDTLKLKTSQRQVLPLLGESDTQDMGNQKAGQEGVAMVFDGAGIAGNPAQISLDLSMEVGCNATSQCLQALTYDFTLPFHPGRILTLHQVVNANGHPLTLEQVVVTPSETRLYIHWQKDDTQLPIYTSGSSLSGPNSFTQPLYDLQLSVGGQTYHICRFGGLDADCPTGFGPGPFQETNQPISGVAGGGAGNILLNGDPQTIGIPLFEPLSTKHGTWTLTITKFDVTMTRTQQGFYKSVAPPSKDQSAKPWVFTFVVP